MMYFVESEKELLSALKTLSSIGGTCVFKHEKGRTVWHVQGDKTDYEGQQLFREIGYSALDFNKAQLIFTDVVIE